METLTEETLSANAAPEYNIFVKPKSSSEELQLLTKLLTVYDAVDHVDKRGRNSFQNYNYVKASDIARALRQALKEQKLFALPTFTVLRTYTFPAKEGEMQAVDVNCEIRFVDCETGCTAVGNGFGSGSDKGDKAIFKAQTGALKYALRNSFLIPDESDPEADEEVDRLTSNRSHSEQTQQANKLATQPVRTTTTAAPKPPPNTPTMTFPGVSSVVTTVSAPAVPAEGPIKAVIPSLQTTSRDANAIPTAEEFAAYCKRVEQSADILAKTGLIKAERGLPIKSKIGKYIRHVVQNQDLKAITVGQWDLFFEEFAKLEPKRAIELIEVANKKEAS